MAAASFDDFADNWALCVPTILQGKFERARALAQTAWELKTLNRMRDAFYVEFELIMRQKQQKGVDIADDLLVLQSAGTDLYSGALLYQRFQVLGSVTPLRTFYLIDHQLPDLLVRTSGPGSNVSRFASVAEAEAEASRIVGASITPIPKGPKPPMARATKTTPATPAETVAPEAPVRKATASALFRRLILEGRKTDEEIFAEVQAEFGLPDEKLGYVKWYRNNMRKKGQEVPDPIGETTRGGRKAEPEPEPVAAVAPKRGKAAKAAPPAAAEAPAPKRGKGAGAKSKAA